MDCFPNLFKPMSIKSAKDSTGNEVWMTVEETASLDDDELDRFEDWDMPINDNMDEW